MGTGVVLLSPETLPKFPPDAIWLGIDAAPVSIFAATSMERRGELPTDPAPRCANGEVFVPRPRRKYFHFN
jgi:hypothetical protein